MKRETSYRSYNDSDADENVQCLAIISELLQVLTWANLPQSWGEERRDTSMRMQRSGSNVLVAIGQ